MNADCRAITGVIAAAQDASCLRKYESALILNCQNNSRLTTKGPLPRYLALRDERAGVWRAQLWKQNIVTDARGDVLRIGFGLYHDVTDIDALVERLADLRL